MMDTHNYVIIFAYGKPGMVSESFTPLIEIVSPGLLFRGYRFERLNDYKNLIVPQSCNVKSNYKLVFLKIILVVHIVSLWYYTLVVASKYLEGMRTGSSF